jgi:hypothetical protein
MSSSNGRPDVHALLGEAQRPERTVRLCLRGDLQVAWDEAKAEFDRLSADNLAGRLTDGAARRKAAEAMAAVETQMRDATVEFRLRALPRQQWRKLMAEHPYRTGEDGKVLTADAMGVNSETFFDALIRVCVVDPQLSDDEWSRLDEVLSDRQFDELANAAWGINRNTVDVPFSSAASRTLTSGAASKRREASA